MKKTLVAILGAALCAGLLPITSSAQTINQRQRLEQARIRQGIRSGELTRAEALRLKEQQAKIRVSERLARRNELSIKERQRLQRELERASRNIRRQKNDRQDRK